VYREHYMHGTDPNSPPTTPPKDEGGLDRTFSHDAALTLCKQGSPLVAYQGLDVRRYRETGTPGEAAHLIDKAVVSKLSQDHPYVALGFLEYDDDHDTSSCNFLGVSSDLHRFIDGRTTGTGGAPIALKYVGQESTNPERCGGGEGELPLHDRYRVLVDIIFRESKREAYLKIIAEFDDLVCDNVEVEVLGVCREAVRVRVLVRNPRVFEYCMNWKFVQTVRKWLDKLPDGEEKSAAWTADEAANDRSPSFGVEFSIYPDSTFNSQFGNLGRISARIAAEKELGVGHVHALPLQ
jgi:hypothetical protein